jgi:hypothetical protein
MKVLFLQHDYFYKEHWQLWRYIRRRIVARKRDGQGISKSFGKLAWYTNFETVSISRNFYKCDATYNSYEKKFNIAYNEANEAKLEQYVQPNNRILGV